MGFVWNCKYIYATQNLSQFKPASLQQTLKKLALSQYTQISPAELIQQLPFKVQNLSYIFPYISYLYNFVDLP